MQKRWQSDWIYLASREEQSVPELDLPVKGLHLPRSVLDKIYHGNARRLFPYSLDGVKDLALRAPIVSALMEVDPAPDPSWLERRLFGLWDAMNPIDVLTLLLLSILENDLLGQCCFCGNFALV